MSAVDPWAWMAIVADAARECGIPADQAFRLLSLVAERTRALAAIEATKTPAMPPEQRVQ